MFPALGLSFAGELPANEVVRLAQVADRAGLDHLWLTEDMFYRGPMPVAGAIAVATTRIKIAFGVLTVYNRHPSLIAMEAVSLIELAGDRLILGIGGGVGRRLEHLGLDEHRPVPAVGDAVAIVRGLLEGDTVDHHGRVHRARALRLDVSNGLVPPIYLAALGPKALQQAGRVADGLILGIMSSPAWVAHAREVALDARAESPRKGDLPIVIFAPGGIDDDGARARALVKPLVAHYARRWVGVPALEDLFTRWGGLTPDELRTFAARLDAGEAAETVIPDQVVEAYCVVGTPDDVQRHLSLLGEAGVTHVAVTIDSHTPDPEGLIVALARIASAESLPRTTEQVPT